MFQSRLLKQAKNGNEKAFLKLVEQEKLKLYKIAYMYMKNENDALDIVQETIMKAFIHIKSVKEEKYFSTWLTRILINTALEVTRKNNKVVLFNDLTVEQSQSNQHEERIDLLLAIQNLEEKYKTVIILKYYQDLTVSDIAQIVQCPEGTVKTNLHRGLNELKKSFIQGGVDYGQRY